MREGGREETRDLTGDKNVKKEGKICDIEEEKCEWRRKKRR